MAPLSTLRYALAFASVLSAAHAYSSLNVPSLDFQSMVYDDAVASKLQQYGIVTLRNVPGYATLRSEYLHAAAECAWQRRSDGASHGILTRTLDDGTTRFTISSTNGVDQLDWSACPAYQTRKFQFTSLVAKAIDGFSAAFDASFTSRGQSSSLREFVADARDMDHFHAYVPVYDTKADDQTESASTGASSSLHESPEGTPSPEETLALSMHSDSGLIIVMSAPAFFRVSPMNDSALVKIDNPDKTSGLLIKLRDGKTIVYPEQFDDELTVMVGDGFSTWVQLPVQIPAVVHGMRMPQTCVKETQIVRAWYGKMVLLSESATMLNTRMDFASYSRQLGEFVESGNTIPSQFASVACPANRQLAENACSYRLCHPLSPSTTKEQCSFWCNTHSMELDFGVLCQSSCACQHHAVAENTFDCWMSCFESTDTCKGVEYCTTVKTNDQKNIAVRSCDGVPEIAANSKSTLRAKVKAFRVTVVERESDEDSDSSDSVN